MNLFSAYLELTKPRLTLLVLASAALGFFMAADGMPDAKPLFEILFACILIGGGVNALNQYLERGVDAKMKRTENRPIPSGRIGAGRALFFGSIVCFAGIVYAFVRINPLTGFLGLVTALSYVFVYTPLKRLTPWNTLAGAVPGALPTLMGWAACQNALPMEAWSLFLILFFWQLPHFFAIAWVYKEDYDRSGLQMLTRLDPDGRKTGQRIILTSLFLFSVTLLPAVLGLSGGIYLSAAIFAGILFILASFQMHGQKLASAKKFVSFSIYYLLILIMAMAADKIL